MNGDLNYYLDTNAVRSLAPQLRKCKEAGAFISILSICEMLGRVLKHPEEYGKIRRNFQSIRDSQIVCIVKMPPELHYGAFGLDILVPMGDAAWKLTQMMLLAIEEPTYEGWQGKLSQYSLTGMCDFVKEIDEATPKLDQNLERQYDTTISLQESIRKYHEFVQNEDKELTHQRLLEYYVDGFIEKHKDVRMMGHLLGKTYEEFKQYLCGLYDGSIDVALRVNACVVNRRVSMRQKCKRNDDSDMMHLYYLSGERILVTDDEDMRDNVNDQYSGRAISIAEFKNILNGR